MKTKSWLRLYHEFADDPKIQMLAFEDQRHYVMVLCLKGRGVMDSNTPTPEYRERMIAKALGLDPLTSREVKFRLMEPGLIDKNWQPVKWSERQFESDNSTERVQKYRDKRKRFGNVSSKQEAEPEGQLVNRDGNVSVTAQIRAEQSKNSPPGNSYEAKSADGRASPTGSPAAPEPEKPDAKKRKGEPPPPPEFDEQRSRRDWWTLAVNFTLTSAGALGICPPRLERLDQMPLNECTLMRDVCRQLTDDAIAEERRLFPLKPDDRKRIESDVTGRITRDLMAIKSAKAA